MSLRREEARAFVVEDGGEGGGDLGYFDDGEEEDWSKPSGAESTDDESDSLTGRVKTEKKEKGKEEAQVKKVNPSLKAAANITGEGRLSSMFTCSSFNKGKETDKVKFEESSLDEVLADFTPDDTDRERRKRRKQPATVPLKNKNLEKEERVTESEAILPPHGSMDLPASDYCCYRGGWITQY